MLTVEQVAERYSVNATTVLMWIHRGELRAVNVGRSPGKRKPRWRISESALSAFEESRTSAAPVERAPRRRRQPEGIVKFY
jgi:excisionase family DNA binding protein